MPAKPLHCPRCGESFDPDLVANRQCPKCGLVLPELHAEVIDDAPAAPLPPPPPIPMQPAPPRVAPPPPPQYAHAAHPAHGANEFQAKAHEAIDYSKRMSLSWLDHAREAFAKHVRDIRISDEERAALIARGIVDPAVQRHFAWRRALLWFIVVPTTFTAILGSINNLDGDNFKSLNALGVLLLLAYVASLWAIPAATVMAARTWSAPKTSRKYLLIGFLCSFVLLLLFGLIPASWLIKFDAADGDIKVQSEIIGMLAGLAYVFVLLPAILSLLPGAIRACVRIKVLFPESIVSGWILITLAPIYALFLLTLFILFNQATSNFLLIVGMAALVAAPAAYLFRTPLFIRPLWNDEDRRRIERAQWIYFACLAVAVLCLFTYAMTGSVLEKKLVGFESNAPVVPVSKFFWHAFKFFTDYIGRSLFITSIAVDAFLLVNVSVWFNTKEFEKTPHAAEHERTLAELGNVLNRD